MSNGSHTGTWFWSIGVNGRAGGDDDAADVGTDDGGVVDFREAVHGLVVVDWVKGDGFHFDEQLMRAWCGRGPVDDFEGRTFGGEDGGDMLA